MKAKALQAFYGTKTGTVKRGEEIDLPEVTAKEMAAAGLVEIVPVVKAKVTNKRGGKQA